LTFAYTQESWSNALQPNSKKRNPARGSRNEENKMETTMLITDRKILEIMPEKLSSLYDDNGIAPDGNAMLPSEPIDDTSFAPRAGAKLVRASYYDSVTIFSYQAFAQEFARRIVCGDVPAEKEERWQWRHICDVLGGVLWRRNWAGYSSKNVFVIAQP
jgi:hypothetical protein